MTKFEYYNGTENVQWYPEAASQSFKKGEFVYLASGLLNVCAANARAYLGVAQADASGTTNNWIPVMLAHTDTSFVGTTSNAGADVTAAITNLATDCELYVASNVASVDIGTAVTTGLRPQAFHPDSIPVSATATVANATNAKVIFKVMDEYSQAVDLDQA